MQLWRTVIFLLSTLAMGQDMYLADSLYATGNYTKAINTYAEQGTSRARLQIARAYTALGNTAKGLREYEALVQQDTVLQIARFEWAKLLLKNKMPQRAREQFQHLVTVANDNPEYHYYLAQAFQEMDQPDSAIVYYKKALAQDSTHIKSIFQLGKYFTVKRETARALQYIDQGLLHNEGDVAFVNLKALVLYNNNEYEAAIPWFEKVLALGEHKEYVYEKLAHCQYKAWEFQKAKATYFELLKFNDAHTPYYYALAETFGRNKQPDSALIYIQKGMELQRPFLAEGYVALSRLAREEGDLQLALAHLQRAQKETPNDEWIHFGVCGLQDRMYKDPNLKLPCYTDYLSRFGKQPPYFYNMAQRRVKELREEIHFQEE